jgi:putative transferase (TIGR04331 family)
MYDEIPQEEKSKNSLRLIVSRDVPDWDNPFESVYLTESIRSELYEGFTREINQNVSIVKHKQSHDKSFNEFENCRVKRYRQELIEILNKVHNTSYSDEYWGILMNTWLLHFVSIVYDRTNKLSASVNQFDNLVIDSFSYKVNIPFSGRDLYLSIVKDDFNQFIYSIIAPEFNIALNHNKQEKAVGVNSKVLLGTVDLKSCFFRFVTKIWIRLRRPVVIISGYFSAKDAVEIMLRSAGKVLMLSHKMLPVLNTARSSNQSLRQQVKVRCVDKYDQVANHLMEYLLPQSLLESFFDIRNSVSLYSSTISAIGSAHGIHSSVIYAALAAEAKDKGVPILGFQHGGNYNLYRYLAGEYYERLYVNRWYGWAKNVSYDVPPTKLQSIRQYRECGQSYTFNKNILLILNQDSRFILRNKFINSDNFLRIIDEQVLLYKSLGLKTQSNIVLRYPISDYGWGLRNIWMKASNNKIKTDDNSQIIDSFLDARLVITNCLSTTWLEVLYLNIPLVLCFTDKDGFEYTDDGALVVSALKEAKILHDNPADAAQFIEHVYDDIEAWWQSDLVKKSVKICLDLLVTNREKDLNSWCNELSRWKV